MPNLLSNLIECFGFSQITKSLFLIVFMALDDMSPKFPIGVATIVMPKLSLFIIFILIFINSCTPINSSKQSEQLKNKEIKEESDLLYLKPKTKEKINMDFNKNIEVSKDTVLNKNITILFSLENENTFTNQLVKILELAVYNKNLKDVSFEIEYFNSNQELQNIISRTKNSGKIFVGLNKAKHIETANMFCDNSVIFFTFSPNTKSAKNCIYLLNFFPKNELEQLFLYLEKDSKVALIYPENNYGYTINLLIDEVVNNSDAVLVNRASYKQDLSNVRDAIKELGKYELRKYELERQKKLLSNKKDKKSKLRLNKLKKFKTTSDYDFTHILIADYGLNLLQVAPLLPYYDIDPNIVQFMSTGVIDDDNFFFEPSLQGTIFPGTEKSKRIKLIEQYGSIYNENLLRISTLPYDLVGLLNYIYSNNLSYLQTIKLINNSNLKFDGVDGKFYFKQNMIQRDLDILKISNGFADKIN